MTLQVREFSLSASDSRISTLRRKIGWICQAIRGLLVFNAVFSLYGLFHAYWLRKPEELGGIAVTQIDFSGASDGQWNAVLALSLALWLVIVFMSYAIFCVFTLYLEGRVFTVEAAVWLRRAGLLGFATIAADFLWRTAVVYILAAHLPETVPHKHMFVGTADVFHVALALILFALGQVQKTAAEIADDHAQIV